MRVKLLFVVICAALFGSANGQEVPPGVDKYLSRNYPGWTITDSWMADGPRPKALIQGDFNGDGKGDYAMMITRDERIHSIVLLVKRGGFQAVNVLEQKSDQNLRMVGMHLAGKGEELDINTSADKPAKSLKLKTDAVGLYNTSGSGRVYYWQRGRFTWIDVQ
jgi:hypothetical protein